MHYCCCLNSLHYLTTNPIICCCVSSCLQPWHFVVLSGSSKAAFEKLTIRLCQERLEPDKAEATVAKLKRKQAKDWTKVGVGWGRSRSSYNAPWSMGITMSRFALYQNFAILF